jgi:hypothetical protein
LSRMKKMSLAPNFFLLLLFWRDEKLFGFFASTVYIINLNILKKNNLEPYSENLKKRNVSRVLTIFKIKSLRPKRGKRNASYPSPLNRRMIDFFISNKSSKACCIYVLLSKRRGIGQMTSIGSLQIKYAETPCLLITALKRSVIQK